MQVVQRFVVVMYDRTSSAQTVDIARLLLFAQKGKQTARNILIIFDMQLVLTRPD